MTIKYPPTCSNMDASLKKTGNLLVFLEMLLVRPWYTIIGGKSRDNEI